MEVLRAQEENQGTVIPTETFASALESIGAPLTGHDMTKLMRIYDKKGEGRFDWDDLISEHKYVNAVCKQRGRGQIRFVGVVTFGLWVWSTIFCWCGHCCTKLNPPLLSTNTLTCERVKEGVVINTSWVWPHCTELSEVLFTGM